MSAVVSVILLRSHCRRGARSDEDGSFGSFGEGGSWPLHQSSVLQRAVEAGSVAGVADTAVALRVDLDQHNVLIAVDQDLDHLLHLTAGLALAPERVSRAAEEPDFAVIQRSPQRLGVHP